MKFYETEVLSLPAGDTINLITNEEIGIYECPTNYAGQKKSALYLSFRGKDGEMSQLYKVSDIIIMKFDDNTLAALKARNKNYGKRAERYRRDERLVRFEPNKEKRVFLLTSLNL